MSWPRLGARRGVQVDVDVLVRLGGVGRHPARMQHRRLEAHDVGIDRRRGRQHEQRLPPGVHRGRRQPRAPRRHERRQLGRDGAGVEVGPGGESDPRRRGRRVDQGDRHPRLGRGVLGLRRERLGRAPAVDGVEGNRPQLRLQCLHRRLQEQLDLGRVPLQQGRVLPGDAVAHQHEAADRQPRHEHEHEQCPQGHRDPAHDPTPCPRPPTEPGLAPTKAEVGRSLGRPHSW